MKVVVVGAGIAGLSAARALRERGADVIVIAPDHGMTARGAGIVSAQFRDDDLRALALRSQEIVRGLVPVHGCGHAQIATSARGAASLDGLVGVRDALPAALSRALAPEFRRGIVRAAFAPDDFWVDRERLLLALADGTRIVRRRLRELPAADADRVLIAMGTWTPRLVPRVALAEEPARMVRVRLQLPAMLHVVESGLYARPDGRGHAVAGDGSVPAIRRELTRVFRTPGAVTDAGRGRIVRARGDRPILRRLDARTWLFTGLGGDGLALGPALGERAADLVLGTAPNAP